MHGEQEARRHLWRRGAGIEQCWCCVGKVPLAHEIVGFEGFGDVFVVDTNGNSQQHVLRTLCDFTVQAEQVGTLECLETEVIVVVITGVINVIVERFCVFHNDAIDFLRNERSMLAGLWIDVFTEIGDDIREGPFCRAVKVVHTNASCQATVIRVLRGEGGSGLSSKLVKFSGGHTVVQSFDCELCYMTWVNPNRV